MNINKEALDDKRMFLQVAAGNEAAFRQLFHKYTPLLHPGVLQMVKHREVAREIVQEVFLKLWLQKEQVGNMDRPEAWMFRVASNLAISHLRKTSSHIRWLETVRANDVEPGTAVEQLSMKELQQLVYEAVEALPDKRQKIFRLSREQGMTIDQIALHLNLSRSTVKNQISIALKFVQSYIYKGTSLYFPLFLLNSLFF